MVIHAHLFLKNIVARKINSKFKIYTFIYLVENREFELKKKPHPVNITRCCNNMTN